MTTVTTSTFFFLGNFAEMDTDESDWDSKNPSTVLGNRDEISLVDVTEVDGDNDGAIMDDDPGPTNNYLSYGTGVGRPTCYLIPRQSIMRRCCWGMAP